GVLLRGFARLFTVAHGHDDGSNSDAGRRVWRDSDAEPDARSGDGGDARAAVEKRRLRHRARGEMAYERDVQSAGPAAGEGSGFRILVRGAEQRAAEPSQPV